MPVEVTNILPAPPQVRKHSGSSFVIKSTPSHLIQLSSQEISLATLILGSLTSKFNLKSWSQEVEWNLKVIPKESTIHVEASPKCSCSRWVVHIERLQLSVLVKMLPIVVELFLRVNELEHLSCLPPLWVRLDHDSIRLHLLNKLLGPLSEHC